MIPPTEGVQAAPSKLVVLSIAVVAEALGMVVRFQPRAGGGDGPHRVNTAERSNEGIGVAAT